MIKDATGSGLRAMPTAIGSEPPMASNNMSCPRERFESGSYGEVIPYNFNRSDNSYWDQTQVAQARIGLIFASPITNVAGQIAHTLICH
jgi:hypothetical protein